MPTEETPDPVKEITFEMLLGLSDPVAAVEEEETEVAATPEEPAKEVATAAVEPSAETAAAPAEAPKVTVPKVKVRRAVAEPAIQPDALAEEVVRRIEAKQQAAKPTPTEEPEEDLSDLVESEVARVELFKYVEGKDPKYAGLAKKAVAFFKANAAKLNELTSKAEENGEEFNAATDPEYQRWLKKNHVGLSAAEVDRWKLARVKEEAIAEADARHKAELENVKRRLREVDARPKVAQAVAEFQNLVIKDAPAEVLKYFEDNGRDEAKLAEQYPLEHAIIRDAVVETGKWVEELELIYAGARVPDIKNNKIHAQLEQVASMASARLLKAGGAALIRQGKKFVAPEKYTRDPNTWTIGPAEIKQEIRRLTKKYVSDKIKETEEQNKKLGFTRASRSAQKTPPGEVPVTPPARTAAEPAIRTAAAPAKVATGDGSKSIYENLLGL
jgi:hypothetical protein